MKESNKLFALLGLTVVVTSCSVNTNLFDRHLKQIYSDSLSLSDQEEETGFDNNPVLREVKNNPGVSVLFLENGLRDSNGMIYHDEGDTRYFRYNSDGYIIKAGNYEMLVDCGLGLSSGNSVIIKKAYDQLISIMNYLCEDNTWDAVVFTHPHQDHMIACDHFATDFKNSIYSKSYTGLSFGTVYDFMYINGEYPEKVGFKEIFDKYADVMKMVHNDNEQSKHHVSVPYLFFDENGKPRDNPLAGYKVQKQINNNNFSIEFLRNSDYKSTNFNDSSVSFLMKYGSQKMLFTGDLLGKGEAELLNSEEYREKLKNVTFYKAGHHGSSSNDDPDENSDKEEKANTREFIEHIRPQYVMVPCVAGSTQYLMRQAVQDLQSTFPAYEAVDRFFKYTDKIYIPSVARNKINDKGKITTFDYASMYGDVGFLFDGEEVEVKTTNLCDENNNPNVPIYNTRWFSKNRDSYFTYMNLIDDTDKTDGYNCSLFKFGHIDVLIDCGVTANNGKELVKKLKEIVVDRTIEYLIVSNAKYSLFSGLLGDIDKSQQSASGGLFDEFTFEEICDFGTSHIEDTNKSPGLKIYKEKIADIAKKYNPVVDRVFERDIAFVNSFEDYGEFADELIDKPTDKPTVNPINLKVIDTLPGVQPFDDNNSLVNIITYKDIKILNLGNLDNYSNLLSDNYRKYIENVTVLRCSNAATDVANSQELLDVTKPKNAVIQSAINNQKYNFGNYKLSKRLISTNSGKNSKTNVFIPSYIDSEKGKVVLCGDVCFKLYLNAVVDNNRKDVLIYTTDPNKADQGAVVITYDENGEGNELLNATQETLNKAYNRAN